MRFRAWLGLDVMPRWFALAVAVMAGCASPVTAERIAHVRKAIVDEREAVTVRPGLEAADARLRASLDADLAAIESACK